VNFNALKIFSVSSLNMDFVAFSLLVKKMREKYGEIRLKALIFFNRDLILKAPPFKKSLKNKANFSISFQFK
jgi:hypothetical protein